MGAYRLRNINNWGTHYASGHTNIETIARHPIFDIGNDSNHEDLTNPTKFS